MISSTLPTQVLPGVPASRYLVGFDLRRRAHLEADVLVIGGGVAGLCACLAAADAGADVLLLIKSASDDSNTAWAQGGVAAVLSASEREANDDLNAHVEDTMIAGAGLCDRALVEDLLAEAATAIDRLRAWGCVFDKGSDGHAALTREGGHSARRILHANGDATGAEVARALAAAARSHPNITVVDQAFALDLITVNGRVVGAHFYRRDELFAALAGATVLATGGCGRVWRETTNPAVATGDGLAMAYRAGAQVGDMEFMQFHPTSLYIAGASRLLITEAMRGEGAVLKNSAGERFMPGYHPQAELAPRDIVTRAIMTEIRRTGAAHVWLDATHLGADFIKTRFPTIHQACARLGIDCTRDWLPVHPSAHYHCGGVVSDGHGRSDIAGLWVAGEVGCTGLHGANRLASNSILEGLVVGLRAGRSAAGDGGSPGRLRVSHPKPEPAPEVDTADLVRSVRALMWRHVGIERQGSGLANAARTLNFWRNHQMHGEFRNREGWELQNMALVAAIITAAATARSASVGTHSRSDSSGDPWVGRFVSRISAGQIAVQG